MKNNHIKLIQTMLIKESKVYLSSMLDNSYYEFHHLDDWNNHSTGEVQIFVSHEYYIELERISKEDKELLIKIFSGLTREFDETVDVKFAINTNFNTVDKTELVTFWEQGYFKLFITHLAEHKDKASRLQRLLKVYGISAFVAHEDIQPSKEWQEEIEKGLHTMDGLTVILMNGIKESSWCDQEIGFAVGREVLIIPIRKGIDPYGFIGKYQAIQGNNKKSGEVVKEIFETIIKNVKTRNKMISCLINIISNSADVKNAIEQLKVLSIIDDIPHEFLEQMSNQIKDNEILLDSTEFYNNLEVLFKKYKITMEQKVESTIPDNTDDIPF